MAISREPLLDELLVLRCQEGSAEAYRLLVHRWQPRLWRHARRLTGRDEAAWDVIQQSWMTIASRIAALADPSMFRRWAYTIVTRRAADWQRAARRRDREAPLDEQPESAAAADCDGGRADENVRLVRTALRTLSGDDRAILALHYFEAFGLWEIAEILGVPEGTVKSRLHHARQRLREQLERMIS